MNMRDIIIAKRDKQSLTDDQIKFFVQGVTDGSIPDYQTSALLMAIVLNGMDEREMTTLTLEMADGRTLTSVVTVTESPFVLVVR